MPNEGRVAAHRIQPMSALVAWLLLPVVALAIPAPAPAQTQDAGEVSALIRAALLGKFDARSVLEVTALGVAPSATNAHIDALWVFGRPAYYRGIPVELTIEIRQAALDLPSLAQGRIVVSNRSRAMVIARLSARDLEQSIVYLTDTIQQPRLRFHAGAIVAEFLLRHGQSLLPARAVARPVVEQRRRVSIAVETAEVADVPVPGFLLEPRLAALNPVLDLTDWPLDLRIVRLNVHNDLIEFLAVTAE
jgi:hypothetical protein